MFQGLCLACEIGGATKRFARDLSVQSKAGSDILVRAYYEGLPHIFHRV